MEVKEVSNNNSQHSGVVSEMFTMGHEKVLICQDPKVGLKAIIAVHSTVCGPSLGGTRMWKYNNEAEALNDVLRLSRGMTYKNAISNLNLGGGKAVIIGDSRKDKSPELFRSFGRYVESLAGAYITAEDVGISPDDMIHISKETKHVSGMPGKSGDPSPVTAFGVYMGMKAAAKIQFGSDSLSGKKIAVQGVGHVGEYLVGYLSKEGANIVITDIHEDILKNVSSKYNCSIVSPEDIYDVDMDIYAPCALGATVNDHTISKLNCSIIAGAANNQLADENKHGHLLMEKGILYAPDFLINAGGVMNCYAEVMNISSEDVMKMAENIYATTYDIISTSKSKSIPTFLVANKMAEDRIRRELELKSS
jgi:leucine dehydrogenase